MKDKIQSKIYEALGQTSALFMSQEKKGTEIVMPTEELNKIGNNLVIDILREIRNELEMCDLIMECDFSDDYGTREKLKKFLSKTLNI